MSPKSLHFVTAGDDKFIRKYDINKNRMDKSVIVGNKVRAIDWSKDGSLIAALDVSGVAYLIDAKELTVLHEH
jgi:hypothetical protein